MSAQRKQSRIGKNPESREPQPNLYLIGFMGVGKSVVGRAVARKMRMQFMDTDWMIEKESGQSIPEIFASQGEAAFRRLERELIESGHPRSGLVVSCGGGLPIQPGMADLLRKKGIVVCLFASTTTILSRTLGNARRPLLNVENPEERVSELLRQREPIYMQAGIGISADGRTISEVVQNVIRVYRREARSSKWRTQLGPASS